jgi:hypothetical protein
MKVIHLLLDELASGQVDLPTYEHHYEDWYFRQLCSWGNHYRLSILKHIILVFKPIRLALELTNHPPSFPEVGVCGVYLKGGDVSD